MFLKNILNIFQKGKYFTLSSGGARRYSSICDGKDKNDNLNLNSDLEKAINNQIHKEMTAMYANIAMVDFFERANISLPGFAKAHASQVEEELKHAQKLMSLLCIRGGNLSLKAIEPPVSKEWQTPVDVVRFALELEKITAKSLINLQNIAYQVEDHYVTQAINASIMTEQMKCIHELEHRLAKLELCTSPECLFLIEHSLHNSHS